MESVAALQGADVVDNIGAAAHAQGLLHPLGAYRAAGEIDVLQTPQYCGSLQQHARNSNNRAAQREMTFVFELLRATWCFGLEGTTGLWHTAACA